MNALQQTGTPVRLGWERTKYHKQAYRHTRFPELGPLREDLIQEVRFLGREDLSEQGWRTVEATMQNRELKRADATRN